MMISSVFNIYVQNDILEIFCFNNDKIMIKHSV